MNVKTGEILAEDNEGDLIKYTKKNSIEAYKRIQDRLIEAKLEQTSEDEKKYEIWTIDSFYKGNTQELKKIMNNLDVYEKAFLFSIAPYIGYDDCCIKCSNNTEMSFDKIIEISGMSKGKLSDVLQELIKKDILYKGKNSSSYQYFVNPWLFCKGNRINKVIKTMFKNYKIQIYKGIKWKDLKG